MSGTRCRHCRIFSRKIPFPKVSTDNYLRQAATDLVHILQQAQPTISTLTYGTPVTNAYIQLAQILKRATKQSKPTNEKVYKVPSPRVTEMEISPVPAPRVVQEILSEPIAPPRVQNFGKIKLQRTKLQHNDKVRPLTGPHQHPLIRQQLEKQQKLRPTKARL